MDRSVEWGGLALRGLLAIIFGIAAVFWPGLTLVTLVYLFGGFVLASGLITLVGGLGSLYDGARSFLSRILVLILGVAEIGVGVYLLRHPEVAFTTLILLVGFVLVLRGVIDIAVGLFEDSSLMQRTVTVISGLIAGFVGVVLLFQPERGGVAFVWILGLYALLVGPMMVALALDIKNGTNSVTRGRPARARK